LLLWLTFCLATSTCLAETLNYTFDLATQSLAPDGYRRNLITVNGQFPGPPIYANKGDTLRVTVGNNKGTPTTIHWHGIFHHGTPWFDGASGLSQCPLPNNATFTYTVNLGEQSGTTWYHAHFMTDKTNGLFGPLIIRDPHDPNLALYDEERIVILTDYYHTDANILLSQFLSPDSQGNEPIPDNGLINGMNVFNCSLIINATDQDRAACDPSGGQRATFDFVPGRRYRLRLINTSTFASFRFSIDNHWLTVIEVDLTPVEPHAITHLNINVAQRYSVVVEANQNAGQAYWIRAEMSTACFATQSHSLDPLVLGIVRYTTSDGQASTNPLPSSVLPQPVNATADVGCVDLNPTLLVPVEAMNVADGEDVLEIPLEIEFGPNADNVVLGHFNNISWVQSPYDPILRRAIGQAVPAYQEGDRVIMLNSTYRYARLIIINTDTGEHPLHLHGHDYQVLAWSNGTYVPGVTALNLNNPLRRDTTTVPAQGYTIIQFEINNPGAWIFHCHIDWHMESGLAVNFIELADQLRSPNYKNAYYSTGFDSLCAQASPQSLGASMALGAVFLGQS